MKEVTESDAVNKVDLYYYEKNDVVFQSALTMGWGALQRFSVQDVTSLKTHKLPSKLRFTSLNILDDCTCYRKLRNILNKDENLICAGEKITCEQISVVNNLMKSITYN